MNNPHYTTSNESQTEIPVKFLKIILKKLKIKELLHENIKDPRKRADDYSLSSLLMCALNVHLFRRPSKNKFYQYCKRDKAAKALAKFNDIQKGTFPCPRTIDDLLLKLNPDDFLPILPAIFRHLSRQKVFQLHPELIPQEEYAIAIDAQATHTYYEKSQHPCKCCPYCLKRTRGNTTWYVHYDLVASFVAPNGLKIPLLVHRIRARPEWGQLSDEEWKQECERTAFPYLLMMLRQEFPRLNFCIHLDALYATDPVLTTLKKLKMGYSIVRKAKVLTTVGKDCEGLKKFIKPLQVSKETKRFNINQAIYFFNDVSYREHNLSIIQLEEHQEKKPSKRFAKIEEKIVHWEWIVHQTLTKENVEKVSKGSRIRWKEEDLFNELQCRGFNICHDFNRAPNSQSVRLYLILIACAISAIFSHSLCGKKVLSKKYTLSFVMEQMLLDIIYFPPEELFVSHNSVQLRFGKDPPV